MRYLWLADTVISAIVMLVYLYLFVKTLRVAKARVRWQQWACFAAGLTGSMLLLIDHVSALSHHVYSVTSDLRFVSMALIICSSLLTYKILKRRPA